MCTYYLVFNKFGIFCMTKIVNILFLDQVNGTRLNKRKVIRRKYE